MPTGKHTRKGRGPGPCQDVLLVDVLGDAIMDMALSVEQARALSWCLVLFASVCMSARCGGWPWTRRRAWHTGIEV